MRILIANWHRTIQGGTEKYLSVLIPELLRRNHSLALLHGYRPRSGVAIDPPEARLPAWTVEEHGSALDEISAWGPDVIYAHSIESEQLENLLVTRFPAVLFVHDYSRTCPSGRKCHAFPRMEPCHRRFGPACLALYYPRRCGGLNPLTMWRDYQGQSRRFALLLRYRAVLVASVHMRAELGRHSVDPARIHVLRLPVAEAVELDTGDEERIPDRILFTGRLIQVKGADYLLRAIHEASSVLCRPLRLTVAGTGPQQPLLEQLAHALNLDVQFKGWVDDEQRHQLMRESDLLAVPSVWPEPFGLVGPEAGSAGLPAVAYASGGIPEWLIAGVSGELAPADPPTVSGLAAAIVRALGDPAHYKSLRTGARSVVRTGVLFEHVAALERILNTAAGRPQ